MPTRSSVMGYKFQKENICTSRVCLISHVLSSEHVNLLKVITVHICGNHRDCLWPVGCVQSSTSTLEKQ